MVNEQILVADLVEDHLRVLARAPEAMRRERCVLQLRPMNLGQLHPVAEPEPILCRDDDVFGHLEVLDQDVQHADRHVRFHLQQRDGAMTQLPQAAVHRFEQIVGLVFLDFQVGIADDAE
jgi:hypothetical protein